jgi:hypothetical protein
MKNSSLLFLFNKGGFMNLTQVCVKAVSKMIKVLKKKKSKGDIYDLRLISNNTKEEVNAELIATDKGEFFIEEITYRSSSSEVFK